ncbi:ef hand family protein [Stylonychia lemnae]|uniref:Ef hand family protein n=1 Tax=Stylonychia lemnae TaxID=5949 RepID=A0A078A224_STYLE|nr:ef hand family protein [Stylonychia lemnae]|eukprot:CDW75548.1 ef hand family protein [Stylonychia lemnae]
MQYFTNFLLLLTLSQTQKLVEIVQQANKIKQKVKKLIFTCDSQKSGYVATSAFLQILELQNIKLSQSDITHIKNQYEKRGGFINYKEVLKYIQVNKDILDPFNSEWLVTKSNNGQKHQAKGGNFNDLRSQISSRSSNYSSLSIDIRIKEKAQGILNKESFLSKSFVIEPILEENETSDAIKLGDDFEIFNQRQKTFDATLQQGKQQDLPLNQNNSDHILNERLRKKQFIVPKPDQRIIDLQQKRGEETENGLITPLQPLQPPRKEGKKINMSPEKYKYNDFISHDHENNKDRQERRYVTEYPNYNGSEDNFNTTTNIKEDRNMEQNHKNKVSPEYLRKMLDTGEISERKHQILKKLYEDKVDFRTLNQLRDKLFESPLQEKDKLPIDEYLKIKQSCVSDLLIDIEDQILDEIKVGLNNCLIKVQNDDKNTISLVKFSELIDFYTYHPVRPRKDKNQSNELYFIMNSNQRGGHSQLVNYQDKEVKSLIKSQNFSFRAGEQLDQKLLQLMDLVGAKLMEKFTSLAQAFRYFDGNLNQSINYHEFYNALDHLGIKISADDSKKIFNYLDTDQNNAVSYNEFCELSEEKRRGIDPFRSQAQKKNNNLLSRNLDQIKEISEVSNFQPKNIYLSNINVDDLEQLSKFQSLSTIRKRKQLQLNGQLPKSTSSLSNYQTYHQTQAYGKKSLIEESNIGDVINQNYLKDYLEQKISRHAFIDTLNKSKVSKSIHNKSSDLRSKSVAKNLKLEEIEKHIEEMKLAKSNRNNISFVEIQKNHHKMRKDINLPPIKQNLNASMIDQSQYQTRNLIQQLQKNNQESNRSLEQGSPITKRLDSDNNSKFQKRSQIEVLDLIHKMRMQMMEQKDVRGFSEKPTNMTKREKEEIISNYYNAKKMLSNINSTGNNN